MNYSEKIAADKTSLGFEFQDFVYIEKLIKLEPGQTLGLELHDDIHVETAASNASIKDLILIQVKHSIDQGNITDRDIDLWKTIYNWLKLVPTLPSTQTVSFKLHTNKRLNNQEFVSLLKAPGQNIQAILDHIRHTNNEISEVESKKGKNDSPNPIAKYVQSISQAKDQDLRFILERFEFHSDASFVIERISSALRQLSIPESCLEETRKHVIGAFKESKFSRITKGEKVIISFNDFRIGMGFDRIIRSARSDPADFDRFVDLYYSYQRPDKLCFRGSTFYEQLKDIGISDEEIIDRGVEMMLAENFMKSLEDAGTFSASENLRLENIAFSRWQLLHNQLHRSTNGDDEMMHQQASQNCYDHTMRTSLKASNIELPSNLSCGKYIKLSNLPRIGWRQNWQSKFKK
jgi:hypothetical protein